MKGMKQIENLKEYPIKYIPKEYQKKNHAHPKLLKLKVNQTKITAYLEDKREISIPVSELVKKWKYQGLTIEKLRRYEIDPWGFRLHFPEADIDTSVLIFTGNYCGCC